MRCRSISNRSTASSCANNCAASRLLRPEWTGEQHAHAARACHPACPRPWRRWPSVEHRRASHHGISKYPSLLDIGDSGLSHRGPAARAELHGPANCGCRGEHGRVLPCWRLVSPVRHGCTPCQFRLGAPHYTPASTSQDSTREKALDRPVFLAHGQRQEDHHHARGDRSALPRHPREHQQGRPVHARVPGDQP